MPGGRSWRKADIRQLTKLAKANLVAWAKAAWRVELDLPTGPNVNCPMSSI
jgi:hypothetical protein